MAQIGIFTQNGAGYSGRIETLSIKADVTLEPLQARSDKAPDYRVFSGLTEIGIAYRRKSEKGNEYISVFLDDPAFAKGFWSNLLLGGKGDTLPLMWDRPRAKA
jgi:uncharacterized protein (DUF736 family)